MLNTYVDVVIFYDVKSRLTVLLDGSCIIGDLEANVLEDGADPLDHFGVKIEGADLGVFVMGCRGWLSFG